MSSNNDKSPAIFSENTFNMARGFAIFLLFIGHYCQTQVMGVQPFEQFGEGAVILFLTISGIGLTNKYGLEKCGANFWLKRVARLFPALWLSLILFYCLDAVLLSKTYPVDKIVLSFLGVISKEPPNGPCWYITYILFLYFAFFAVSWIKAPKMIKLGLLFGLCFGASIVTSYVPLLKNSLGGGNTYRFVFPLAVLLALNSHYMDKIIKMLYSNKAVYVGVVLVVFAIYYKVSVFKSGWLILLFVLLTGMADYGRVRIKWLEWLGDHSYEIYLFHFPFIASYKIIQHNQYAIPSVIACVAIIVILSVLVKKGVNQLPLLNRRKTA